MATTSISGLPETLTINAATVAPVDYSASTYKVSMTTLGAFITTNAVTVSATGTVTGGNVSAVGTVTAATVATTGVTATTVSATGTVTGGNLSTAGTVTATGTVTGGNLSTAGTITATGTVTGGNLSTAGTVTTGTLSVTGTNNIMPTGMIVMWYGSIASIPTGWYLCNGQVANGTQTPDLRNFFIVGAGSTYAVAATGGSADAIVVSHTHTFTGTELAPHNHTYLNPLGPFGTSGSGGTAATSDVTGSTSGGTPAGTNSTTGVSGTNANLPPYYALAYIMKA